MKCKCCGSEFETEMVNAPMSPKPPLNIKVENNDNKV